MPQPAKKTSDEWYWAIQYVDAFASEAAADEALLALYEQVDFIAGRTIAPSPAKPGWRVQAFFEDTARTRDFSRIPRGGEWLPDNLRRVVIRPSFIESFLKK
jgi:hypothetical protein